MNNSKTIHRFSNDKKGKSACNICGKVDKLTWDHVPPKGGIKLEIIEQETILQHLTSCKIHENIFYQSQNGVKYRTLCRDCNSYLGQHFDPSLNEFSLNVGMFLKSSLIFPKTIYIDIKPNRIVRSIYGHLLAAKTNNENTKIDESLRNVILDHSACIPCNIRVFYWIYPYTQTVIMRDFGMPAERGCLRNIAVFSLLKYFPVAYLVSTSPYYENLTELTKYCSDDIDAKVKIPVMLRQLRHPDWPEMVDDENIIFGGASIQSSICAKPKRS